MSTSTILRVAILSAALACCAASALAQGAQSAASGSSGASPGTVGAMQGVEPSPGVGTSSPAPKLVRKTPGSKAVTQPARSGDRAASGASAADGK